LDVLRLLGALFYEEADALAGVYLFLRDVENKLQMAHDVQTHVFFADDDDLLLPVRRLGYGGERGYVLGWAAVCFRGDFRGYTDTVHRFFGEILGRLVSSGSVR
jgi:glutamine synthetase adenylyltransferase